MESAGPPDVLQTYREARAFLEQLTGDAGNGQPLTTVDNGLWGCDASADAAVLFLARGLHQVSAAGNGSGHLGLPLSKIAAAAGINLFDFFRELPVVMGRLAPFLEARGVTPSQLDAVCSTRELQKTLVAMTLLSRKYKDVFNKYLARLEGATTQSTLRLGWTLFLVAKARLLPRFPDLVSCMEVLASVLELLLRLRPALGAPQGGFQVDSLGLVCGELTTDKGRVHALKEPLEALCRQLLSSAVGNGRAEATDPLLGLLSSERAAGAAIRALEREYQATQAVAGEIDEVEFLQVDMAKFASPRMSPATAYKLRAQQQQQARLPMLQQLAAGVQAGGGAAAAQVGQVSAATPPPVSAPPTQVLGGPTAQAGQRLGPGTFSTAPVPARAGAGGTVVAAPAAAPAPDGPAHTCTSPARGHATLLPPTSARSSASGSGVPPAAPAGAAPAAGAGPSLLSPLPPHQPALHPQVPTKSPPALLHGLMLPPGPKTNALRSPGLSTPHNTLASPSLLYNGSLGHSVSLGGRQPAAGSTVTPTRLVNGNMLHSPLPIMHLGPGGGVAAGAYGRGGMGPGGGLMTPVTEAMGTAAWLRAVTAPLSPEPSAVLRGLFEACHPNPEAIVAAGIAQMARAVLPDEQPAAAGQEAAAATAHPHDTTASERRTEAIKLYYLVLEGILLAEEQRASASNKARPPTGVIPSRQAVGQPEGAAGASQPQVQNAVATATAAAARGEGKSQQQQQQSTDPVSYAALLASSNFHKGLMACCLEVVIATYRMVSAAFPKVLDCLKLHAFDLSKIVQPFVKHLPGLPLELKRHMYLVEEKVIESLAWEAGSSLYGVLTAAVGGSQARAPPSPSPSLQRPQPAASAVPLAATTERPAVAQVAAAQGAEAAAPQDGQVAHAGNVQVLVAAPTLTSAVAQDLMEVDAGRAGQDGRQARSASCAQEACSPSSAPVATGHKRSAATGLASVVGASPAKRARSAPTAPQEQQAAGRAATAAAPAGDLVADSAQEPSTHEKLAAAGSHTSELAPALSAAGPDHLGQAEQHSCARQGEQPVPAPAAALPTALGRPPTPAQLASIGAQAAGALGLMHDFMRKALKLAWFRIGWLCQAFDFTPLDVGEVHQRVYETVEHALYSHTSLMYNRHLDQVILCALYGYCKVHKLGSISFKEIIAQYRRQPQATQAVFRSVALLQTNPGLAVKSRGDIIAFYNTSFVPAMKMFLLKGSAGSGLPPMHPGGNLKLLSPGGGGLPPAKPATHGGPAPAGPAAAGTASPTPHALMAIEGGVGQPSRQQQQQPPGCPPPGPPPRSSVAGFFPSLPRTTSSPLPQPLASPVPGAGGSAFQPYSAGGRTPVGLPKPPTPGHSKPPLHPSPPTQTQQRSGGGAAGGLMSLVMAAAAASKSDAPQTLAGGTGGSAAPSPHDSITRSPSPAAIAAVPGVQETQPAAASGLPARSPSPGFTFTVISSLAQLPPEVAAAAAAGNPTSADVSREQFGALTSSSQVMTAAAI